jgi:hypothetical protein
VAFDCHKCLQVKNESTRRPDSTKLCDLPLSVLQCKIEFDANQFDPAENTIVRCPHCELETIIFVPEQKVPPVVSNDDFHLRNAREVEREEEIRKTGIREGKTIQPRRRTWKLSMHKA